MPYPLPAVTASQDSQLNFEALAKALGNGVPTQPLVADANGNASWGATPIDSGWIALTALFVNSWVSAGLGTPAYRRISNRVWFRGAITTGTSATTAFTLPAGYRPAQDVYTGFNWQNGGATATGGGYLHISTAGVVVPIHYQAAGTLSFLDSVSFPVD